eukprot:gene18913-25470_t
MSLAEFTPRATSKMFSSRRTSHTKAPNEGEILPGIKETGQVSGAIRS